jgi:hypothetical protein
MHDARLQRRLGIDRGQRLAHPFQAVGDGDQEVAAAPRLEVAEHLYPELGALGLLDPEPEDVARAIR